MSLFEIRPGIEGGQPPDGTAVPLEAKLHGYLSTLASDYIKLIKDYVLQDLDMPDKYSIRDIQVLIAAFEAQTPVTSSQIFKSTGLDPATVTRAVKKLVADKYFDMRENQQDSRSRFLDLTPKGNDLAKAFKAACVALFQGEDLAIPGPSEKELKTLRHQLERLSQRVKILRLKNF